MKIAFFTDTYYPAMDGVVRSVNSYKIELEKRGHEVKVFAPAPAAREERRKGVVYADSISFWSYAQYRIPINTSKCVAEAVKFKPDIVHSHAMVLMALAAKKAAKKCNAPLVGTYHTLLPKAGHYLSNIEGIQLWFENICWKYLRWLYGSFDLVFAPSEFMQKRIAKHGIKSEVMASPLDVKKFSPGKINSEVREWIGEKEGAVLFFGRVAKEKNIDFLIDMVKTKTWQNWKAKLIIAGEGPYRGKLMERVEKEKLGEFVKFAGKIDEKLVPSFYRAALCTIFPSEFETQGLTALESMACGTPVVALRGTALAEVVVPGKSGALCEKDAQNAVYAMQNAIKNRKKLGKRGREIALKYSAEKCTDKLLEYYKREIGKR
ncbi:MAG: glycosyltransferase [Candidatus Micrarchaeota archaeon]